MIMLIASEKVDPLRFLKATLTTPLSLSTVIVTVYFDPGELVD